MCLCCSIRFPLKSWEEGRETAKGRLVFQLKSLVSTQEDRASPKRKKKKIRQRARSQQLGKPSLRKSNFHPNAYLCNASSEKKLKLKELEASLKTEHLMTCRGQKLCLLCPKRDTFDRGFRSPDSQETKQMVISCPRTWSWLQEPLDSFF